MKAIRLLIRPLSLLTDLLIINAVIFYFADKIFLSKGFLLYVNLFWIVLSYYTGFYKIYRFTVFFRLITLLSVQLSLFFLAYFAYFGIFARALVVKDPFSVFFIICFFIAVVKFISFYVLKIYRRSGRNYRNVVVLGMDDATRKIIRLFNERKDLGYRYFGFFSDTESKEKKYLGPLKACQDYLTRNNIDEIYCSLASLNREQVKVYTKFAIKNSMNLKLIPESGEFYSKHFTMEFYENTLVLNVKKHPFDDPKNSMIKRVFDIVFSLFAIVFVLSWLTPVLWVMITLGSKGPLFFRQEREGLNGKKFTCYKFRSMKVNNQSDFVHTIKDDERVTKIGGFLRKTSIDEAPQFFNVLRGDMSIVGPRPHMNYLSLSYQKEIDNYMARHAVKPGITGLAQVSGYRGEVKKRADIKNRVRLDIFYIENWSFFLDLKIIIQTILNVFKGEEKAY
ncbi:MAG: undecaprenyl-phosphate glucose phosphotransferase [Flavobacteriaceae bacterium]|nr:undecaprenyl-phosphate glucose phosphotransferase [Flavobacteriaceae bacterium]